MSFNKSSKQCKFLERFWRRFRSLTKLETTGFLIAALLLIDSAALAGMPITSMSVDEKFSIEKKCADAAAEFISRRGLDGNNTYHYNFKVRKCFILSISDFHFSSEFKKEKAPENAPENVVYSSIYDVLENREVGTSHVMYQSITKKVMENSSESKMNGVTMARSQWEKLARSLMND